MRERGSNEGGEVEVWKYAQGRLAVNNIQQEGQQHEERSDSTIYESYGSPTPHVVRTTERVCVRTALLHTSSSPNAMAIK